jgi:hypothetical protein
MERPIGITILAVAFIVLATLSLLWSGLVFGVGGLSAMVGGLFGAESMQAFGRTSGWSGFVGIIGGLVQFVVAFGLLAMKKWAWVLALVGVALTIIEGIIAMFTGGAFAFMCGTLGLIIPVLILIYLLTKDVRSAFGVDATYDS